MRGAQAARRREDDSALWQVALMGIWAYEREHDQQRRDDAASGLRAIVFAMICTFGCVRMKVNIRDAFDCSLSYPMMEDGVLICNLFQNNDMIE